MTAPTATPPAPSASPAPYRTLKVWQKGIELAVEARRLAKLLPRDERDHLAARLVDAALAVPAKIAFGQGAGDRTLHLDGLAAARDALSRVEALLEMILRLEYVQESDTAHASDLCNQIRPMLVGLIKKVGSSGKPEVN